MVDSQITRFGDGITKNNLIDIVCKWMDTHNKDEKYIESTLSGKKYICGRYQTDLRKFIGTIINDDYWTAIDKAMEEL